MRVKDSEIKRKRQKEGKLRDKQAVYKKNELGIGRHTKVSVCAGERRRRKNEKEAGVN